jgi:hypothetical protein
MLADPTGAFSRYFEVPAEKVPWITVHEETAGTWHIVLPAKAAGAGEFSETDLEKVAGGTATTLVVATATVLIFTAGTAVSNAVTPGQGW